MGQRTEIRRETFVFAPFGSGAVLHCTHRGSTVWCPTVRGEEGPLTPEWSKNTTIPLFNYLDLPSEQQLVIKLTSQQAHALALASRSIVVQSGGNSFFQGIPGQKAGVVYTRPSSLGITEWEQSSSQCVSPRKAKC